MQTHSQQVRAAAQFLKRHVKKTPRIGIITGTGLGESLTSLEIEQSYKFTEIPNFPESTVQSHDGKFIMGSLEGCQLVAIQGRLHLYEGYSPKQVTFPVRVMKELGVQYLIISNAAGGLNLGFNAGDIMLILDHINLTGENPLIGKNENQWGVRFPDMAYVYDRHIASLAKKAADFNNMVLQEGVYVGLKGPSMETPAETRFLRQIGADAVGFSTVMEVIAAVHAGMKILGLSTITNINDSDHPRAYTVEEIINVANQAAPKISLIIQSVIRNLNNDASD